MAGPVGNGFRCHSLYCSLIFFISFPSLFPYLFMMFAVIGSGLSGHAAEILISFEFSSPPVFFSPHLALFHTPPSLFVFLSLCVPATTTSLVPEKLVLTHSPSVWHFPTPFLYFALFLSQSFLFFLEFLLRLFLLCSWTVSTQTPLFQPGADGGVFTRKSHSICLK